MSISTYALAATAATGVTFLSTTPGTVAGVHPAHAIAGVVGAAITFLLQKPVDNREAFAIAVCGTASSMYGTGVACRKLGITESDAAGLVAIVLGVSGIFICRRLVVLAQDPRQALETIRSGKLLDLLKTTPRAAADDKTPAAETPTKG